ncbi:hypothetical protein GCM10009733_027360 [Nonomuraea maheshkhaliensis]|uniref:Uncharacterized protein n=1 Tax=Nonomuraea maheshkhaliensis TaxID=419590 RepID=A0ABN2F3K7_9ACTN
MAPDWRPNARAGTEAAAVNMPIWDGDAVNRVIAVSGMASFDTSEPVMEIVRAVQSRR